jgi:protein-S-isoprenylcysteine O-methyltransferase Ste14
MARSVLLGLFGGSALIVVVGGILFGCAGRWDLPFFWAFLGVWVATMLIAAFVVDPGLIKERTRPGPGGRDYLTVHVLSLLWLGQLVVAGLDAGRFHWTDTVPVPVQVAGLVAMVAGMVVLVWAESVNRFFSSVIRIQTERGHHVITTGPYQYLRHPGYAASPLVFLGGGLALGSWLATLIGLPLLVLMLRRTVQEDRILHEQLEGYAAYAEKVRYRLFPGIW